MGVKPGVGGRGEAWEQTGLPGLRYNFFYFAAKLRTSVRERPTRPQWTSPGTSRLFSVLPGGSPCGYPPPPAHTHGGSPRQPSIPSVPRAGGWTRGRGGQRRPLSRTRPRPPGRCPPGSPPASAGLRLSSPPPAPGRIP